MFRIVVSLKAPIEDSVLIVIYRYAGFQNQQRTKDYHCKWLLNVLQIKRTMHSLMCSQTTGDEEME